MVSTPPPPLGTELVGENQSKKQSPVEKRKRDWVPWEMRGDASLT